MIITSINNKKETLQKLFPLEAFLTFENLAPLSWEEVFERTTKYEEIKNIKFNLDGTLKSEFKDSITPQEMREYWLKRLSYFKTSPSIIDEDFNNISVVEIKESIDNDWLIKNGVESLSYAIFNNETLNIVGDEDKLKSLFSSKQIKETRDVALNYLWNNKEIDLNTLKVVNEEVFIYNVDWIQKKDKNCLDEIKYYLEQSEEFKEKYRGELFQSNKDKYSIHPLFSLLDKELWSLQDDMNFNEMKNTLLKFIVDVSMFAVNNNLENAYNERGQLIKFVLENITPELTVEMNKNQIKFIQEQEKNNSEMKVSSLSVDNSIKDNEKRLFQLSFNKNNKISQEDALILWNLITRDDFIPDLNSQIEMIMSSIEAENKVVEHKFSQDTYPSNLNDEKNIKKISNFNLVVKEYFDNKENLEGIKRFSNNYLDMFNIVSLSQSFSKNKIYEDNVLNMLSKLSLVYAIVDLEDDIKLKKLIVSKFNHMWLSFIKDPKKWSSLLYTKERIFSKEEEPNISMNDYIDYVGIFINAQVNNIPRGEILDSIYGENAFNFGGYQLKNAAYKIDSNLNFHSNLIENEKISEEKLSKIINDLSKLGERDVGRDISALEAEYLFENILEKLEKTKKQEDFSEYLLNYLTTFKAGKLLSIVQKKIRNYKKIESFFEKLDINIDVDLFKIINKKEFHKYDKKEVLDGFEKEISEFLENKDEVYFKNNILAVLKFINSSTINLAHNGAAFHFFLEKNIKNINVNILSDNEKNEIVELLTVINKETWVYQFLFKNFPEKNSDILNKLNENTEYIINVQLAKKIIQMPEFQNNKQSLEKIAKRVISEYSYIDFKGVSEQMFDKNLDIFLLHVSAEKLNCFNFTEKCKNPLYALRVIKSLEKIFKNYSEENTKCIYIIRNILKEHNTNENILLNIAYLTSKGKISDRIVEKINSVILDNVPLEIKDMLKSNTLEQIIRENSLLNKMDNEAAPVIKKKKI